jgi:chromatin segregation and condensation protein Rec8/ScpA/Scc1 (kleisin family)
MGSPKISGGMTLEQRQQLLESEERMSREREKFQREQMLEQESQRRARERAERGMLQQEEQARTAELERLEQEAAGVAEEAVEEDDVDTSVADMFAALAFGTDFIGDVESEEEEEEGPGVTG